MTGVLPPGGGGAAICGSTPPGGQITPLDWASCSLNVFPGLFSPSVGALRPTLGWQLSCCSAELGGDCTGVGWVDRASALPFAATRAATVTITLHGDRMSASYAASLLTRQSPSLVRVPSDHALLGNAGRPTPRPTWRGGDDGGDETGAPILPRVFAWVCSVHGTWRGSASARSKFHRSANSTEKFVGPSLRSRVRALNDKPAQGLPDI
jgi:hypothetical protein